MLLASVKSGLDEVDLLKTDTIAYRYSSHSEDMFS